MGTEVRTALVTAPDARSAESMARTLVEEGLAACVNVIPGLVSVYRWKGEVQRDEEALMILKTTESGVAALRERVVQLHPYEVPEVLFLNVVDGHEAYLAWVREAVGDEHG
jgi:periplasmic divalent cation tolerance protein